MVRTRIAFCEGLQALTHRPSLKISVQKMAMADSWNDSGRRKPKYSDYNLSQWYFSQLQSHVDSLTKDQNKSTHEVNVNDIYKFSSCCLENTLCFDLKLLLLLLLLLLLHIFREIIHYSVNLTCSANKIREKNKYFYIPKHVVCSIE